MMTSSDIPYRGAHVTGPATSFNATTTKQQHHVDEAPSISYCDDSIHFTGSVC